MHCTFNGKPVRYQFTVKLSVPIDRTKKKGREKKTCEKKKKKKIAYSPSFKSFTLCSVYLIPFLSGSSPHANTRQF